MKKYTSALFLLPLLLLMACQHSTTLFEKISSSHSGIYFNNKITESDTMNPMNVVNIYNGGGVGVGDFNNDGLQDIYFTGNMVPSRLYLNRGDFTFEDITDKAGVEGMDRWARGVSVVDINNDGLMDIYICNTIYKDSLRRRNILYVNQGPDKDGIPHFKDMAAEYGLDVHMQSTMASFFDYDNDGDLDMYVTVNEASNGNSSSVFLQRRAVTPSIGRLYRNDMDSNLHHGVFHDVSQEAGMVLHGYGHAATICDLNNDGWKDIYVSNDFLTGDILYINNQHGGFTDEAKDYFKHTSFNAMGQDIVDINNDGLADVVELDMNPRDNYRKKMMLSANNYNTFQNFGRFNYQFQYVRNTLQLNQGPRRLDNDSIGAPAFSEIGFMSGISQTDWSWTPLVGDFDNDGLRDIIITNGFPRDVSDHDFITYRDQAHNLVSPMKILEKIPVIKLPNYAFKNIDGLRFADTTNAWGLSTPSFSNGAAYADLDNDGDLDMIVNNVNDEAFVYRNTLRSKKDTTNHFIQVICKGGANNINGFGASVHIYYGGGQQQVYEINPYRGYLSSNQNMAHFGLGAINRLDSVVVDWPGNKKQVLQNVPADQVLHVDIAQAKENGNGNRLQQLPAPLFREVTKSRGITYWHKDFDFIDFNIQTTLPHKLSEYSPALAAADLNGDGLDDMVSGGNGTFPTTLFFQQPGGNFTEQLIETKKDSLTKAYKDEGVLLFDANGDGYTDIYVAAGSYNYQGNSASYQDRLYINDGRGKFSLAQDALPVNYTSKLCVRAIDINKDGKLDLFVSGRVDPWKYPKPVSSFIFRNDSHEGVAKFTDVTAEVAPDLQHIGMVCDALFTDFDNDNQVDLVLAGEWMPVTFLKNINGKFRNITPQTGLSANTGWWNSIVGGDFRNTGRTDYIVGNTGMNTLYQPTPQHPVYMTAKDFDNNGSYVPVTSLFLPATDGKLKEFPAEGRDDIIDRIPTLKKRFNNYKSFAESDMQQVFTPELMKNAQRLNVTNAQSCYFRNDGNGKFSAIPLPLQAQVSPINGMLVDDFDGDGNLDVLINGNDYGMEVSIGRQDASNGLLLKGDGKGNFMPLSILQSGIYIPEDGKALVKLRGGHDTYLVAASQNRGPMQVYQLGITKKFLPLNADDVYVMIHYNNGTVQKSECYFGAGFLSQSARELLLNTNMKSVDIYNSKGAVRSVDISTLR